MLVSSSSGRAISILARVKVSRGIMHGIAALQVDLTFFRALPVRYRTQAQGEVLYKYLEHNR